MIVEGIVTSQNADGLMNVAPMGPIVHGDFESLTLRPFCVDLLFLVVFVWFREGRPGEGLVAGPFF